MSTHTPLRGVITPLLTPFNDDGTVAYELLVALAQNLLSEGAVGLVPFGTTGEATSVGTEERIQALQTLAGSGVPADRMIPGVGLTNIPDTMRLVDAAREVGCPGGLVLPPFYYKNVADDGLYEYYAGLIRAIGEPSFGVYIYHIPQVAGVGVPVPVVRNLREDFPEHVVGIKDSSGDWDNTEALLGIPGLAVYPGNELRLIEALELGAPGCITATANVNSRVLADIVRLYDEGEVEQAQKYQQAARGFRERVQGYGPIPAMKQFLAKHNEESCWGNVRPPLQPGSTSDFENVHTDILAQTAEIDEQEIST